MFETILEQHAEEQDNFSKLLELKSINAEELSKDTADMCVEIRNLTLNKESERQSVRELKIDICNQFQSVKKELEVISRNITRIQSEQDRRTYASQTPHVEDKTSIHVHKEESVAREALEDHKSTSSVVEISATYTNPRNYPKVDVYPKFGGSRDEDWVDFIDEIDTFQESYGMPDSEIVSKLPSILKGVAYVWFRAIHKENKGQTWNHWKSLIKRKFGGPVWRQRQLYLLEQMKFSYRDQDILKYLTDLHRKLESLYPKQHIEDVKEHILMRLPMEVQDTISVTARDVTEISEYLVICERVLSNQQRKTSRYMDTNNRRTWRDEKPSTSTYKKDDSTGDKKRLTIPLQSDSKERIKNKTCHKCKGPWSPGHTCNKINNIDIGDSDESSVYDNDEEELVINEQDDDQVMVVETEVLHGNFSTNDLGQLSNIQEAEYVQVPSQVKGISPAKCTALVNQCEATLVLDSGAGGSVVSSSYLQSIDPQWRDNIVTEDTGNWKGYGSTLTPVGSYVANVIFGHERGNIRAVMKFVVMENEGLPRYFIVGNNNILLYGIRLHLCDNYFTLGTNLKRKFALTCEKTSPIQHVTVVAKAEVADIPTNKEEIPRGEPTKESEAFEKAFQDALWDPQLPKEDKEILSKVIRDFPMVFAHGERQLGEVTIEEFDIHLQIDSDKIPASLRKKAYPCSPQKRKDIETNIKELLDLGVLEELDHTPRECVISPVIIQYQNGKARMCGDFRSLNDFTVSDIYGMPRTDAILHGVRGATRISLLDGFKGYHQFKCTERASNYLIIITHCGMYRYKRMPFGPKNGPSVFQRTMDRTFCKEIREGWMTVYIDDIIIHSQNTEDHAKHLRQVFTKLEQINLTLAFKKCHFAFQSTKVLGHIVSGLLMSVDGNKVKAIQHIQPPRTIKEVQSFLGMCGYYRQYLKNYQLVALSLTRLIRRNEAFEWTDERQKAFDKLKQMLEEAPSLSLPDFDKPFILYTDASFIGLGAALHQKQIVDGKEVEVPVCFISRSLRNGELRYGATQLECLAVVWALEKLHYYLDGSTFEVVTDCSAVKSLLGMKTPNRHMFRWQIAIQEYRGRMTISHRPGDKHQNADCLSRNPMPNTQENPACVPPDDDTEIFGLHIVDLEKEFYSSVAEGYNKCPNLRKIIKILSKPDRNTNNELINSLDEDWKKLVNQGKFIFEDDLLYYRKQGSHRLVIHESMKEQIMKLCHDDILAGHFSLEKTLHRVKTTAWWLHYHKHVTEYISTCDTCQKGNRKTGKTYGLMQEIQKPTKPWEIINMDFVTGLPPAGDLSYNSALVVVCRLTKKAKFIPCHKDIDAKGVAHLWWKYALNECGLPSAIISDRDPKFTSEFWTSLMRICGCDLKLSTAHHPQTDGLAERTIQTMEDLVRRYCAFGILYKDSEGCTHDWVSLLPGLEFAYNSTIHASTGRTPFELERGYIPQNPRLLTNKKLGKLDVHPSAGNFSHMQELARAHAAECISKAFAYDKQRWDKTHTAPTFKVGDEVLLSTVHFNNLNTNQKLKDPFIGPFTVVKMVGTNAAELDLHGAYSRRHPVFPVSLIKMYKASDPVLFPGRKTRQKVNPDVVEEEGEIQKVLQQRVVTKGNKKVRQFLVSFKNKSPDLARWVHEEEIPNGGTLLRKFRKEAREEKTKK
jgi:hypothetical protein